MIRKTVCGHADCHETFEGEPGDVCAKCEHHESDRGCLWCGPADADAADFCGDE